MLKGKSASIRVDVGLCNRIISWEAIDEKNNNKSFFEFRGKLQGDNGVLSQPLGDGDYLPLFMSASESYNGEASAVTDKTKSATEEPRKEDELDLYPYGSTTLPTEEFSNPNIATEKKPAKESHWEPAVDVSLQHPMQCGQGHDTNGEFEFVRAKGHPISKSDKDDPNRQYLFNSADYLATPGTSEPEGNALFYESLTEPLETQILNSIDFLASGGSKEGSITQPSQNDPSSMDPLNWETAAKYQNRQGLFELSEEARNMLHLHFCPSTKFALAVRLSKILHDQGLGRILCIQIIDSMMIIKCYQTHLALTEDIWDLMMERAQDAMAGSIGQETVDLLEGILTNSMMHQHHKAATREEERDGGLTGGASYSMCNIRWQASRTFCCPFNHSPGTPHAFKEWDEFWKHQQQYGHIVCPREGTSA